MTQYTEVRDEERYGMRTGTISRRIQGDRAQWRTVPYCTSLFDKG